MADIYSETTGQYHDPGDSIDSDDDIEFDLLTAIKHILGEAQRKIALLVTESGVEIDELDLNDRDEEICRLLRERR